MALPGKTRGYLLLGVFVALAGIVVFLVLKPSDHGRADDSPANKSTAGNDPSSPATVRTPPSQDDQRSAAPPASVTSTANAKRVTTLIHSSLESFRANQDPEQARKILQLLRDGIHEVPDDEAAAAIVEFLKSGDDAPTGLPFVVGPDGMMDTIPTLRLALLDLLPSLDPVVALDVAREIMNARTSADEYALSLRNMAWNDLDGDLRNELSDRFLDLLKTPWLNQPSAGFLEAFDIAVEVGGLTVFNELISLTRQAAAKPNAAVNQAAFISLDRMILRDPQLLTAAFSDPTWMNFAPQQRASLLSRLNIVDPEQKDVFARYLSSTPHVAGELDYFARIFPNENFLYGHRLVTADDATPTIAEVTAADKRVISELDNLGASVSGEASATIQKIRQRLEKSVAGNAPPAGTGEATGH